MDNRPQAITFAVDAGNTALKIGVFEDQELIHVYRFNKNDFDEVHKLFKHYDSPPSIVSSVLNQSNTETLCQILRKCIVASISLKLPIAIDYKSKLTLGMDRLCNAIGVQHFTPKRKAVAVDIGTCIKFDVVDENAVYLGGSIAPGIDLRYQSLHNYTANLPFLSEKTNVPLIGRSTLESISSGVMNGIQAEINQLIHQYDVLWPDCQFLITGGDASCFYFQESKHIILDEHLTLKGLFKLYLFNAH